MHPLLALSLVVHQPAVVVRAAQPPATIQPTPAAQPALPQNLSDALGSVFWDTAQRGVLLVVGAEMVRPRAPLPPPASGRGYNVRELAAYFDRMVVPAGNVTALVPATMRVFTKPTQSPDEASWSDPKEAFMALLASLSKSQWQTLSGENGLGLGDLAQNQRGAFLASLADMVKLSPIPASVTERTEQGSRTRYEPLPAGMTAVTLTPELRNTIRIRVSRELTFQYAPEGMDNAYIGGRARSKRTEAHYQLDRISSNPSQWGGIADVPNRPKPGDLDLARLRGTVTLTGAATVGELVKRASQVSQLELYADPRVGNLSVRVWGESASAGDVLSALCRAVTGTFRKVGPAYVLTHDRDGIAALREPHLLWQSAVSIRREERRKKQEKAMRQLDAASLIGFGSGDTRQLSPDQLRRMDAQSRSGSGRESGLAVSELPPALQQQVRDEVAGIQGDIASGGTRISANGQNVTTLRTDRVWTRAVFKSALIIPSVGAVAWDDSNYFLQEMLSANPAPSVAPPANAAPPANTTLSWPQGERIALVSARTPDEAMALARAAKKAHLTGLWLKVPLNAERAGALIKAAQSEGILVGAALSPFEVPTDAIPPGAAPDLAATGVTSDVNARLWLPLLHMQEQYQQGMHTDMRVLRGDDAILLAVEQIARLPRLAGIVFTDLVPPGYQKPVSGPFVNFGQTQVEFGYTPENRLAFLRQVGADPVDLGPSSNYDSVTSLPFFPPFAMVAGRDFGPGINRNPQYAAPLPDANRLWKEFRAAQNAAFAPRLQLRVHQAAPEMGVYVRMIGMINFAGSWDKPEQPPVIPAFTGGNVDFSPRAILARVRPLSRQAFNLVPGFAEMTPAMTREGISYMAKEAPGWDGLVLDLQYFPADRALATLAALSD